MEIIFVCNKLYLKFILMLQMAFKLLLVNLLKQMSLRILFMLS